MDQATRILRLDALEKWWLALVPYTFTFEVFMAAYPEYTWAVGHLAWPLFLYYWLAYYAIVPWTLFAIFTMFRKRSITWMKPAMFMGSAITFAMPLVMEHRWPGT